MTIPLGTYENESRTGVFTPALPPRTKAGTMESKSGSARNVPVPFRNVRLESRLFLKIIWEPLPFACETVRFSRSLISTSRSDSCLLKLLSRSVLRLGRHNVQGHGPAHRSSVFWSGPQ